MAKARVETRKIVDLVCEDDGYSDLVGYCVGGIAKIANTPHYAFATGLTTRYREWQESRGKDVGAKAKKFVKLIESIRRKGVRNPIKVRGDVVVDGHHRAAIWLALGHEEIPCRAA